MDDYDKGKWFDAYRRAVLELEHEAMTGRIGEVRAEIVARLGETLLDLGR